MNLSEIEIIEVSVHYGETKSLPEYSNVKPGYSLRAAVKPGQDPEEVKDALAEQVKQWVWEDCDKALEREGRRAEFYQGPRYNLRILAEDWLAIIVPENAELPRTWNGVHTPKSSWRLESLRKYTIEKYGKLTLLDLSDGNLEVLPELQEYHVIWLSYDKETFCLALPDELKDELPDVWQNYRNTEHRYYTRLVANFLPWITEEAKRKEATLIDALDGDLSKLPDLAPKEPVEQAIADGFIPDIYDDDGDSDDWEDDDDDDDDEEPSF